MRPEVAGAPFTASPHRLLTDQFSGLCVSLECWCMADPSGEPHPGEPVSLADREEILDQTLIAMTGQKGRVETRGQTSAVVVFGKPVNHVLHLLLLIFTCSL